MAAVSKLLTAATAELKALYVVVVRIGGPESGERRRRLCLRRHAVLAGRRQVGNIYLESRAASRMGETSHCSPPCVPIMPSVPRVRMDHRPSRVSRCGGYLIWWLARSVPRRVHVISRASRVEQRGRNHRDPRPRRRPGAQDLISGSASARRAALH
jgi:hypothetical protein